MTTDKQFLVEVLRLAESSSEPIKCATLIVQHGKVIAQAYNSQRTDNVAINHAEIKAIELANRYTGSRTLEGATAYCNCEPCAMCLVALSLAKVQRVVFSRTMQELAPHDDLSKLNSEEFVQNYLNSIPKLERLVVS